MQLLDCLSKEDLITIKEYVEAYCGIKHADCDVILKEWNKQKRTLYKALGHNLRVSFPVDLSPTDNQNFFSQQLSEIYLPPLIRMPRNYDCPNPSQFIVALEDYMREEFDKEDLDRLHYEVRDLFGYKLIEKGYIFPEAGMFIFDTPQFNEKFGKLEIKTGAKIIKSIRKFLVHINFPEMGLFEEWRNAISNLTTKSKIHANLVISIHPIDFLTLSDNNCGWTSCYNWKNHGAYSGSAIEMMNSNMMLVAYLESNNQKFYFNMHEIPNKSWRTLIYCHKNILITGKGYPYHNDNLSKIIIKHMREMLYQNLHWKYQYGPQPYKDLVHLYNNHYLQWMYKPSMRADGSKRHNIFVYTYSAYNDLLEDNCINYWCCRNYVPHPTKICASGPHTCMNCGEPIRVDDCDCYDHDRGYPEIGDRLVCYECEAKQCDCCSNIVDEKDLYKVNILMWPKGFKDKRIWKETVCRDCLFNEYKFDTVSQAFVLKTDMVSAAGHPELCEYLRTEGHVVSAKEGFEIVSKN